MVVVVEVVGVVVVLTVHTQVPAQFTTPVYPGGQSQGSPAFGAQVVVVVVVVVGVVLVVGQHTY